MSGTVAHFAMVPFFQTTISIDVRSTYSNICTLRAKFGLGITPMHTYPNPIPNGANRPHFFRFNPINEPFYHGIDSPIATIMFVVLESLKGDPSYVE